jgi:EAL and modified HD-GYP domain-containing signal transduction protein
MSTNVYLGRQPILDRHRRTYAYALLYRNGERNESFFCDPDHATGQVLELTMLEWGFDRVVGDRFGFVNVAAKHLDDRLLSLLPAGRAVIIIDSPYFDVVAERAIRDARLRGLRFAVSLTEPVEAARAASISELFDFVRIDVLGLGDGPLSEVVTSTRRQFPRALLIAGRVDDDARFATTCALGFDLFQGFFFAKPTVMQRARRPASSVAALCLLTAVNRPSVEIDEVTQAVSSDATLAYEFLKLVNSSAHGMPVKVQSISHAVMLVGVAEVRRFALLLSMAVRGNDVSDELIVLSATRARMAEALAGQDRALAAGAYTAGLFSVLDVVFATPMEELLADLPLLRPVRDALLWGAGEIGQILATVYAFEHADAAALARLHHGDPSLLMDAFAEGAMSGESMRSRLLAH